MTIRDAGTADASAPIVVHQIAQWGGRVTVRAIDYPGRTGRRYQVTARWHGPPMHGFPPQPRRPALR